MYKKISCSAFSFAVANAFAAFSQLYIALITASFLDSVAFGFFSIYLVSVSLFTQALGLGLTASIQRDFFQTKITEFQVSVSSSIYVMVLFFVVVFLGVGSFFWFKEVLFNVPVLVFVFAVLAGFFYSLQQVLLIIWQSEGSNKQYFIFSVTFSLALIVSAIYAIYDAEPGWFNIAAALTVVYVMGGVGSALLLARKGLLVLRLCMSRLKVSLLYSLPLVPHQLSGWGMAMLDRFLIVSFSGPAAVGAYSLSFQVAQALNVLSGGFNQAFTPWLFKRLKDNFGKSDSAVLRIVGIYVFFVIAAGFLAYYSYRFAVFYFDNEEHRAALTYAPWLLLAMSMNAIYRLFNSFIMFDGHTGRLAILSGLITIISFIANYFLIKVFGAIAASWTCALSFTLLAVCSAMIAFFGRCGRGT